MRHCDWSISSTVAMTHCMRTVTLWVLYAALELPIPQQHLLEGVGLATCCGWAEAAAAPCHAVPRRCILISIVYSREEWRKSASSHPAHHQFYSTLLHDQRPEETGPPRGWVGNPNSFRT